MDLKAFKGTAAVAVLLIAALAAVKFIEKPVEEAPIEDLERTLFDFEKQDLVKTVVTRPDGETLTLIEQDDGWILEETGFRASKSMVNRVKHQLHDLTARAQVIEEADDPALYGLGESSIHVELSFRDGRVESFRAGDPNPSSVSYYIQPDGDSAIFTVKKSAVDYYSLSLDEFRERRFAGFNSKDADRIAADLPEGRRLELQRIGEKSWQMIAPREMPVSLDEARSLLGRVAVLKAVDFVADQPDDLSPWGLDEPRARITISFGTREPLTLLVGAEVQGDEDPSLSHMLVVGEDVVYTAKDQFLDDYIVDPDDLRDRSFMDLADEAVVEVLGTLHRSAKEPKLVGEVPLKKLGDVWTWYDGKPVPGSTPRRLAERAASVDAEEFVDGASSLKPYGLDEPMATIRLVTDTGIERVLLLGDAAESRTLVDEEREIPRLYAKRADIDTVYVVDEGVLNVLHDALREQNRKLKNDAEKEVRRERLDEEMSEG